MKLEEANKICDDLLNSGLSNYFKTYKVCGSIRRKQPEVNDIDIVAIPKPESDFQFGEPSLSNYINNLDSDGERQAKELGKQGAGRFLNGDLIKRFKFQGAMIDLYLANEQTFQTLVLIRTGSAEHNVRLTTIAKYKNMKLKADGKGLVDRNDESIIYENTEDGILQRLLGNVPIPEKRGIV